MGAASTIKGKVGGVNKDLMLSTAEAKKRTLAGKSRGIIVQVDTRLSDLKMIICYTQEDE